jgi:hypothetical protein
MSVLAEKKKASSARTAASNRKLRLAAGDERIIVKMTREEAEFHNAVSLASAKATLAGKR